eukprot:2671136-Rhodomonas_salina.2
MESFKPCSEKKSKVNQFCPDMVLPGMSEHRPECDQDSVQGGAEFTNSSVVVHVYKCAMPNHAKLEITQQGAGAVDTARLSGTAGLGKAAAGRRWCRG